MSRRTGGQCVEPPVESYGEVSIGKMVASGTGNEGESDVFNAVFPTAPALERPPVPAMNPDTGQADVSARAIAGANGVSYHQALPSGFVAPGRYTIASQPGAQVSFPGDFLDR